MMVELLRIDGVMYQVMHQACMKNESSQNECYRLYQ